MNDLESSFSWEGRFPVDPQAEQRLRNTRQRRLRRTGKPRPKTFHPILSDVILENTPRYEPLSSSELYDRVVADYGHVDKRVFYRRMQWLRASGAVVVAEQRRAGFYDQLFYVKAEAR